MKIKKFSEEEVSELEKHLIFVTEFLFQNIRYLDIQRETAKLEQKYRGLDVSEIEIDPNFLRHLSW
jgi:hypothetical protein